MQRRKLRDLEVSALGLGCMGMSYGYGKPKDVKEMRELIAKAYDRGINFFDTAEVYGPYTNEELVGSAIKGFRDKIVVATKFGIQITEGRQIVNSSLDVIKKSIEGSLKRLNIECIDLYYQHRVDTNTPIEEVANLMAKFHKEGKIKAWGLSEAGIETIKKAHSVFPLTAIQSEYSMWWREPEKELFNVLEDQDIGFVAFSPLGKGFLSGRFDANSTFGSDDFRSTVPRFNQENIKANLALIDELEGIAQAKNATKAQIALAWNLAQKPYIVPIFGTTSLERLDENLGALGVSLSQEELDSINSKLDSIKIVGERYSGDAAKRVGK
ncbi:aldehyde oxidase [Helicobacter pullorum]|uniref:aldo/keto reductase n=1 Tax=Helicobacter pullorum TaxID=35818 RepID=UPI000816AC2A|nr:aldo/keto reductase [Helicobacter pullorum]OCR05217.1 aldehyde oxidase [Helicobacter pullorum]OCR08265.1 aldehyde oxidase [Helicobacter pullorum]OCR11580.1 aldehyde oxidase [Helicobacter pullorum]OCR13444.1 aldehyde oxidase [Helicobacter pullorum]